MRRARAAGVVTLDGAVESTLRATSQRGIPFPAGSEAGFVGGSRESSALVSIRTYLGGELQDIEPNARGEVVGTSREHGEDNALYFFGFRTHQPFDAVEMGYRFVGRSSGDATDHAIEVREFCSDRSGDAS